MSDLASVEVDSESHSVYTLQNGEDWTVVGATNPVDVSRLVFFKIYCSFELEASLLIPIIDTPWLAPIDDEGCSSDSGTVAKPEGRQTLVEVNGQHYQVPVLPFEHLMTGETILWTNVCFRFVLGMNWI